MLLSIDVCADSLSLAAGSFSGNIVNLEAAASVTLPPATVENGYIRNHAAFAMTVGKLLAARGLRPGPAIMTFTSDALLSRRLELPASKPRDIARMVKNEMIQTVNTAGEYVYEYTVIGARPGADKGKVIVWAYAAPREMVDGYAEAFKSQKLRPVALDAHQNSVEKLFTGSEVNGRPQTPAVIFADMEDDGLETHLFSDGRRVFSRLAPVTSSELRSVLGSSGAYSSAAGDFWDGLELGSDLIRGDQILNEAVHQYVNAVSDELRKMAQFQLRRDSTRPVTSVYIYGGMAQAEGFDQALSSALGIDTETVVSVSKVKNDKIKLAKYINAVGALIRLRGN